MGDGTQPHRARRKKKSHHHHDKGDGGGVTASSGGSSRRQPIAKPAAAPVVVAGLNARDLSVAPPVGNLDASLRAELAETRALGLGTEAVRFQYELAALRGEVGQADGLIARCEAALKQQHELLMAARAQLVEADTVNADMREDKLRAEHEAGELRVVLKSQMAKQVDLQAQLDKLMSDMAEQGEVFRQTAAKIAAHREAEGKAFAERRRIWERTIDDWLKDGFSKRIDPILYSVNQPVYARLSELLSEEQAQREHQAEYLKLASAHEIQTLRGRLGERVSQTEALHAELVQQRSDFSAALSSSLSSFVKAEMAAKAARIASLERESRVILEELRDTRATHDRRDAERAAAVGATLQPMQVQACATRRACDATRATQRAQCNARNACNAHAHVHARERGRRWPPPPATVARGRCP